MPKNQRRPKGEGSVQVMPNGSYKMTITIGVGADGKQKRRCVTAKTKAELMKRAAELRVTTGTSQRHVESLKFQEVVEMYIKEQEDIVSPATLRAIKGINQKYMSKLYDYYIDKITPEMIDYILDEVKDTLSSTTLQNIRKRIASVFNYAVKADMLVKSPMLKTRKRPPASRRVDVVSIPSDTRMKAIIEATKEWDARHKTTIYPLCLLALATGMRYGELLGLNRHRDIDTERHTISISYAKTAFGNDQPLKTPSSTRTIFVRPEILEVVLKLTENDTEYLFPLHRGTYDTHIHDFFHECPEVPEDFTFHCFRHYHATYLLRHNINVKQVSKRLGHKSIVITLDLYAHWIPEMDEVASNTIPTSFI